jgi:hypothetical protein
MDVGSVSLHMHRFPGRRSEKFDGNARLARETVSSIEHAGKNNGIAGREHDSVYGKLCRALDAEHEVCTMGEPNLHI